MHEPLELVDVLRYRLVVATLAPLKTAFWRQTLTATEAASLQLLANGYVGKQVAGRLSLTLDGLGWQLRTARRKLGARNTTHAVAIALRRGLIAPP